MVKTSKNAKKTYRNPHIRVNVKFCLKSIYRSMFKWQRLGDHNLRSMLSVDDFNDLSMHFVQFYEKMNAFYWVCVCIIIVDKGWSVCFFVISTIMHTKFWNFPNYTYETIFTIINSLKLRSKLHNFDCKH